jgi:peptide/nickel transport system substrate-binding protein
MKLSSLFDRRARVGATGSALVATLALAACGGGGGSTSSNVKEGGTMVMALDADAQSLNPFNTGDVPSVRATMFMFPNLYQLDKNLQAQPDLADGMPSVSADKKTWTVKIRKGAKWSDGTPITANDVVTTVQIQANPDLDSDASFDWSPLTDPKTGVTAKDDNTVVFTLSEVFAPFLSVNLQTFVAPASVYGKIDVTKMKADPSNDHPTVTGGPFRFDKRITGQEIDLVANPDYYAGKPHIAKVVEKVITDSTAAAQAVINGDVNWNPEITAAAINKVKAAQGVKSYQFPDLGYYDVRMNTRAGHLFNDVNVRRAFAYALDKDSIVKAATDNNGTTLWGDIVPASAYYDESSVVKYKQDIAKAKQLMDDAGWKVGADGIRVKDGKKFSGKFYVRAGKPQREKAVQIMSEELRKNLGMDLQPSPTDFKIFYKPIRSGEFDLAFAGFSISADPDDYTIFHSSQIAPEKNKSGSNWTGYVNPELDAAIEAERKDLKENDKATFEARKKDVNKLEKILGDNVVTYFMWADNKSMAFNHVQGYVPGKGDALNYVDSDRNTQVFGQWYMDNAK